MPKIQQKYEHETILGGEALEARDVPPRLPKGDIEGYGFVRLLVGTYYDIQENRIHVNNRLAALKKTAGVSEEVQSRMTYWTKIHLDQMETEIRNAVQYQISTHPLWVGWLKGVRGVGPCIAGSIIAYTDGDHYEALKDDLDIQKAKARGLEVVEREVKVRGEYGEKPKAVKGTYTQRRGIGAFDTVSKYWTYCGIGLNKDGMPQRPQRGVRSNYCRELQVVAWKAAESFVRLGAGYRKLYEQQKARLEVRGPQWISTTSDAYWLRGRLLMESTKSFKAGTILTNAKIEKLKRDGVKKVLLGWRPVHIEKQARRIVKKIFMSHVWMKWRELEGLPFVPPYIVEHGDHRTIILPYDR